MTFNKINPQSLVVYVNQYQKQLHTLIVVLLSLYLIAFAAKLLWRIIPEPQLSATTEVARTPVTTSTSVQGGVNLNKIQQLNLFGDVAAAPKVEEAPVTDAPETRLNLTLTGVVASSLESAGTAVIENRNQQLVYGLGDKIDGTNATLKQVYADRVIIKNGIRNETLMLEGIDYDEANKKRQRQAQRQPTPAPSDRDENESTREISGEALLVTTSLRERPASFTDFISVSPKSEEGQLIGYQVGPGVDPTLFKSAGLKAGDVVTQINGLDLTDMQQSKEALGELRTAQSLEFTIIRDGSLTTLYLDLPEPSDE
ncbi:type II secretion system protein GspC [Alteromonas sp. 345S023]|uniref:Type II secretion system protein GspC n=1 Tax=Alteromonas profundi TaxID=2696062 RepID=A0A7X5RKI1_9ALTE|nr:type II secretion system protein GspC [Alteromonas profundi]NDV90751.1 type II secretion system protein GspC [Alteromonas profundi]